MDSSFEPGGLFYQLLRADAARWAPKRAVGLERLVSDPTADYLLDELEELRYRLAESERATEERKTLFAQQLNQLRLERDELIARVGELEDELSREQGRGAELALTRAQRVRRGLVAGSGLAAAAGVVKLALSLRQALEGRFRRPRLFRPRHA